MRGPAEAGTLQGGHSRIIAMNTPAFRPRIVILYCTQCQWLLRAGWMAQELLSTFSTDLGEVVLQPGTGGIFQITYNGDLIWDRKSDGGFPDAKVLKQRVRDRLDPGRPLGHIDGHTAGPLAAPPDA
jgi:selenoprotein W-related protein